jgi:ATP/maltotriose-dependent transcriptional regulator MalT
VDGQLLAIKLCASRRRYVFLPRPRLCERLGEGMGRRLTLISAPAGFGKTTLLSQWFTALSSDQWPVGWLSLDEVDNDPSRFWTYFIAALRKVHPDVGEGAMTVLRSPRSPPVGQLSSRPLLEALERANFFVVSLDEEGRWYHSRKMGRSGWSSGYHLHRPGAGEAGIRRRKWRPRGDRRDETKRRLLRALRLPRSGSIVLIIAV